jgi:hypothetical protein
MCEKLRDEIPATTIWTGESKVEASNIPTVEPLGYFRTQK